VHADRLASLGRLVSGVAHELNNPLTAVQGLIELALEQDLPDGLADDLEVVHSEACRAGRIVKDLLAFARRRPEAPIWIDLNDCIEAAAGLRAQQLPLDGIRLELKLEANLPVVNADPHQVQQVFLNLLLNAEHALRPGGGTVRIRTWRDNGAVMAEVSDDGPGIPPENLGRIFDPFFTTRAEGQGTGLGLSLCHGILRQHGGSISASNGRDGGAVFRLELPVA
jgi:two-component system NtrC family sensor kinase